LKLIIITQGLSYIVKPLVENPNHKISGIVESAPRKKPTILQRALSFMIRGINRSLGKENLTLKEFSYKNNIPYYYLKKGDFDDFKFWLTNLNADLIVVRSMSQLLKKDILKIPKKGAINIHSAYLPEYRGPNPVFWQYYDYVLNPGVTIHFLDEGEDTGDIILQERFAIKSGETLNDFYNKLSQIAIRLLMTSIEMIDEGTCKPIKQPKVSPTKRARNISKDESNNLVESIKSDPERFEHLISGYPMLSQNIQTKIPIFNKIYNINK
jgi:methionyl-tRNA formyltransferase